VKKAVDELLGLKAQYKALTGEDPPATAPKAVSPPPLL
jgi:hypothetical protein